AEAASGLVRQLRADGVDVDAVLPDYSGAQLADEQVGQVPVPDWAGGTARIRRGVHAAVGPVTLVTTLGTERPNPYVDASGQGWPDNDVRFFGFSAAVAALVEAERPDVVHLNDWHTAPTLGFLAVPPPTVFTIHTLGHQGIVGSAWLDRLPHRRGAF